MAEGKEGLGEKERLAKLHTTKRLHAAVGAYRFFELLLLAGFCASGYVAAWIVGTVAIGDLLVNGAIFGLYRSKWLSLIADPRIFLAQKLYAFGSALFIALAAPQIIVVPLCMWIAITIYGRIALKRDQFLIALGTALACTVVAFVVGGSRIAMPTSSLAGQILTLAALAGLFVRGFHAAKWYDILQQRRIERSEALRVALERIEILAQRDELTGLPNRRSIMEWLAKQIAVCEQNGQPLTVALIDLDHFKRINDTFGHLTGDLVLQKFSENGLVAVRAVDRLGRFGGEEFLVGLVNTSLPAAEEPLQRLRHHIGSVDWTEIDARLCLTVTIGAASYRHGETIEQLIRRADVALYRGKMAGRDRVVLEDRPFVVNLGMDGQLSA